MHERAIIEGHDWKRWRARIVVVEDGVSAETGRTCHDQWEPYLSQADYLFAFFDGVNRFYVRKEDENLLPRLQVPANSTDDFVTYERQWLTTELARWRGHEELGPVSLLIVRKLRALARRYPRTSATTKSLIRFVLAESQRARAS